MELEFDRDVIQGCEVLADGTVCQEETLESIVPDACPDILRIVAVCGQAALNGKQAKEGMAQASGTVRAVILYQPEAGGGLRRMEAALPFTAQLEAPGLTDRGTVQACVRLRGAEARALNPRKVLLRADLAVDLTAFQPKEQGAVRGCWSRRPTGSRRRSPRGRPTSSPPSRRSPSPSPTRCASTADRGRRLSCWPAGRSPCAGSASSSAAS